MPGIDDLAVSVQPALRRHGVAIVLPAFLDGKEGLPSSSLAGSLPSLGLDSITFDPRGTWSSPGIITDIAPTTQLDDLQRLLDRHPGQRVVLIGHCYGALLALLAAASDLRITDVVALMPTRCFIWAKDYEPTQDTWQGSGPRLFLRKDEEGDLREYWVPHSVVKDAISYDLVHALSTLRQRTLFVAGSYDELIPVDAVRQLHDACGSRDKEFAVLPVQHDYSDHADQVENIKRRVLGWVDRGRDRRNALSALSGLAPHRDG